MWRLGGKRSDFKLGKGARFCFQHDARRAGAGRISLFDNEAARRALAKQSRSLRLRVDEEKKTATVDRAFTHPGDPRVQPGQHAAAGERQHVRRLGRLARVLGVQPRRAAAVRRAADQGQGQLPRHPGAAGPGGRRRGRRSPRGGPATAGGCSVYASWNGATGVARWQVLAGDVVHSLRGVASKRARRVRDGDHRAPRRGSSRCARCRAAGKVLATSKVIRVRDAGLQREIRAAPAAARVPPDHPRGGARRCPSCGDVRVGLLHLFIRHTSASLTLNENASPDVRRRLRVATSTRRCPRTRRTGRTRSRGRTTCPRTSRPRCSGRRCRCP